MKQSKSTITTLTSNHLNQTNPTTKPKDPHSTKTNISDSTPYNKKTWIYSDIVKDHFLNPRNFLMGDEDKFKADATGIVGNPICGDQMKMFLKINAKTNTIVDIKWKTYGCASAIASTSALSELAKGKTLKQALTIDAIQIETYLGGLPQHKFHCSVLGHEALRTAINNYLQNPKKSV